MSVSWQKKGARKHISNIKTIESYAYCIGAIDPQIYSKPLNCMHKFYLQIE